ncbi:MAG: [FeFe] hydrogenase H-cluster radical SAM maturase HydE [Eubacteriales bacterium]
MEKVLNLCEKLRNNCSLSKEEYQFILEHTDESTREQVATMARDITVQKFGRNIYGRALIELTSFCRNDCYYCGLRRSNDKAERYRLTQEQVLDSAAAGYAQGYRTFVIQGGEDGYFTDQRLVPIVRHLRTQYPDVAITLSIGERSYESYAALKEAGANRYLLRQETITENHYNRLHPQELQLENRIRCLRDLKALGYQVGTGIMVGSPYQTNENIADDFVFFQEFRPHMIGIGPFLPHKDTPFHDREKGSLEKTLLILSLLRLMDESLLLPSTTALATLHPQGRELGILAGANVIMPNVSPSQVRKKYMLYDNKVSTGEGQLEKSLDAIGYKIVVARGDHF